MGAGLACVAADVGDVASALTGVGLLVPPGDVAALASALRQVVAEPGLRTTLGAAARERVAAEFTAAATARAVLAVHTRAARG